MIKGKLLNNILMGSTSHHGQKKDFFKLNLMIISFKHMDRGDLLALLMSRRSIFLLISLETNK